MLVGDEEPDDPPVPPLDDVGGLAWGGTERLGALDVADVAGQEESRTALVVAAAGGHHLFMVGPPGIGKTMLAHRLPGLLPDLPHTDALEVSAVHSLAGTLSADAPLVRRPPFIDPHHTASAVAIVGGGSRSIRPGALSLAHRGVLFLDEAPEFASNVLDALRQPLESGHVVVSRAAQTAVFPARFQLVLAANPCPCGQGGTVAEQCECTPLMRRRYRDRISGPVRDRIDIHRVLTAPSRPELAHALGRSRSTADLARRRRRGARPPAHGGTAAPPWLLNSDVPGVELRKQWPVSDTGRAVLDSQLRAQKLSARSADRVLRLVVERGRPPSPRRPRRGRRRPRTCPPSWLTARSRAARPGGGLMTPKRRARLALSLLCEPGDPRLPGLLADALAGAAGRGDPRRSSDLLPTPGRPPGPIAPRTSTSASPGSNAWPMRPVCAGSFRATAPGPTGLDDLDHVEPLHGATGAPLGLWIARRRQPREI